MAEETDEATNELIARILAADNDQFGYEDFGNADLSDDSDYGGQKKKKAKRGIPAAQPLTTVCMRRLTSTMVYISYAN